MTFDIASYHLATQPTVQERVALASLETFWNVESQAPSRLNKNLHFNDVM